MPADTAEEASQTPPAALSETSEDTKDTPTEKDKPAAKRPVPLGPLWVAASGSAVIAGSSLYSASGIPGVVTGGVVTAGVAAGEVVRRARKNRSGSKSRSLSPTPSRLLRSLGRRSGAQSAKGVMGLGSVKKGSKGRLLNSGSSTAGRRLSGSATRHQRAKALEGKRGAASRPGPTGTAVRAGRRLGGLAGKARTGKLGNASRRSTLGGPTPTGKARAHAARNKRLGGLSTGGPSPVRGLAAMGKHAKKGIAGAKRLAHSTRQASSAATPRQTWKKALAGQQKPVRFLTRLSRIISAGLAATWVGARNLARKNNPDNSDEHLSSTVAKVTRPLSEHSIARTAVAVPTPRPAPLTNSHSSSTTGPIQGGITMSGFRMAEISAEMHAAASSYTPETMTQVGQDLRLLPEALGNVAQALRITVQRAQEEYPIHPQIIELLSQIYQLQMQAAQAATEAAPAFRALHQTDLARHESPRRNEHMWNV